MHCGGHCGKAVEFEGGFTRLIGETEVVSQRSGNVLGHVASQRFEYLRNRLESMDPDSGDSPSHVQRKQPDVRSDIEDRFPLANQDTVTLISALGHDLPVEDDGFELARSPNLEMAGKGYAPQRKHRCRLTW